MFWVISVYFNIRNTLPKSRTFLLLHPVYQLSPPHHRPPVSLSVHSSCLYACTFISKGIYQSRHSNLLFCSYLFNFFVFSFIGLCSFFPPDFLSYLFPGHIYFLSHFHFFSFASYLSSSPFTIYLNFFSLCFLTLPCPS